MQKEMRRKDKALEREETMALLEGGEYGVLATVGEGNLPYAVPLNYAMHDGKVYFHCAALGHKIENIAHNANVSFCVTRESTVIPEKFATGYASVILFGKAAEVTGEEKEAGLLAIARRFSGDHMEAGKKYIANALDKTKVFAIEVEHMSGKASRYA